MRHVSRNEYLKQLERLPIVKPTTHDFVALCPHLEPDEAIDAFACIVAGGGVSVACPPVRVKGAYLELQFDDRFVDKKTGDIVPPTIHLDGAFKTKSAMVDGAAPPKGRAHPPQAARAMKYAMAQWGRDLVIENWSYACEISLDAPKREGGGVRRIVTIGLSVDPDKIIRATFAPTHQVLEAAIMIETLDPIESLEITTGHETASHRNCARCGCGLGTIPYDEDNACEICGAVFDPGPYEETWTTPLPTRLAALLASRGHAFVLNPQMARDAETAFWTDVNRLDQDPEKP